MDHLGPYDELPVDSGIHYGLANERYSWEITDINLMVPGDILINTSAPHAVMVLNIIYPNNNRVVLQANVTVIEATKGTNNEWRVLNTNN